jgi:uncharacterized repeat protein (TIGR01451 family)
MNQTRTATTHRPLPALALLATAALFGTAQTDAATIEVAAGVVAIADDGLCSLREAIINANDNAQTHADCPAGEGDNILSLPAGSVFTLTNAAVTDAFGNTGLPYVTRLLNIFGNGATIRSGNSCNHNGTQAASEFRLFLVRGVGLGLNHLTLAEGCADGTGNARLGGAIYLDEAGLQATAVTVRDNRAFAGAGIYSFNNLAISFVLSTLSGNTATQGAAMNVDGQTDLINSTLTGNSTFSLGAGAYLRPGAILNFDFVTVDGSASAQSNEIHASGATLKIKNSLFRNARCSADAGAPPSSWIASGNNLDSSVHCANLFGSNIESGATINLGPLADNGGLTHTRALLADSRAIDAALDCTTQAGLLIFGANIPVTFDQREEPRPQNAACDIGAFESALARPPQTIHVDEVDGVGVVPVLADGLCSLREALENANNPGPQQHTDCEAGGGADTVVLPAGVVFTLSDAPYGNPFSVPSGLPLIVFHLNIAGQGATIQRNTATSCVLNDVADPGELRLLQIEVGANLTIEDLTLANGCADGGFTSNGGAIRHAGQQLILRRSTIRDSRAGVGGGISAGGTTLIEASTLTGNSASLGGALDLPGGDATVRNSTLSGNSASNTGGAIYLTGATLNLEQSTLSANTAPNGGGIGASLFVAGVVNARNSILQASTCWDPLSGGEPYFDWNASGANLDDGSSCADLFVSNFTANAATNLGALASNGGTTRTHALLSGSQALNAATNCTSIDGAAISTDQRGVARPQGGACDIGAFERHTVTAGAGTIIVDEVSPGTGATRVFGDGLCSLREAIENANANSAVFLHPDCESGFNNGLDQIILPAGAVFTLTDAAITAPHGNTGLPAISSLIAIRGNNATIESGNVCTFDGVPSASEFRFFLVQAGALSLEHLTLANGCADGTGSSSARDGGAVHVEQGGVLIVQNANLRNNRARRGGAVFSLGDDLFEASTLTGNSATFGGAVFAGGTLTLSNSTLSGNSASSLGGAAFVDSGAVLNIEQSSFNGSGAALSNGIYSSLSTVNLKNTILNNSRCDENSDAGPSTWNALGDNLDSASSCANLFASNVTPNATVRLGPLADNGGTTQTHALLPGSPAIDAVTSCTRISQSVITVDQRDIARPQGAACDIGAFESRGFTLGIGGGNNQSAAPGMPFAHPLNVTVTPNAGGEPVDGGVVLFTAPVAGASASLAPNPAIISAGSASTIATANATAGSYVVAADTAGSSTGVSFTLTNLQPTTTTITAHVPVPSVVGEPYLVSVNVAAVSASPLGTVTISNGEASCGPIPVSAIASPNSTASCALTSSSAGSKTLTASFTATGGGFGDSISDGVTHQVNPAATSISVSGPPRGRINTAASYSFALSVDAPGAGTPAGTVTLSSGAQSCAVAVPTATPSCALTFDALGARTISAAFVPSNGDFLASGSSGAGNALTLVFALSDIAVTKSDGVGTYFPGDLLVYTVAVRNLGADAAAQIRVHDPIPAGLVDVAWSCDSSGGATCPASGGSGNLDVILASFPVGGLLNFSYFGNIDGSPSQIVNTASIELPADTTIEDPQLGNNSASDTNLLEFLFLDGFESPAVSAPTGSYRLPSDALRGVLDEVARVVYGLDDVGGEAVRVYARVFDGELQYAIASRDSNGTLRLGEWRSFDGEPTLSWTALEVASGWRLVGVELN